jgi:exodeoxyribonuclease VII large subunit
VRRFRESRSLARPGSLVRESAQRLDDLSGRLERAGPGLLARLRERLSGTASTLRALDPHAILERGYSICRAGEGGAPVTDAAAIDPGVLLDIRFRRGRAEARTEKVFPDPEGG